LLTLEFNKNKYVEMIGEELPRKVIVHELHHEFEVKPPLSVYKRYFLTKKVLGEFKRNYNSKYDFLFLTQASSPFELNILNKNYYKSIGYVHFPEMHYEYENSGFKRKIYLWPIKNAVERGAKNLDGIICNSFYTQNILIRYWGKLGVKNPVVIHPPVDLDSFWSTKPFKDRDERVIYVGRFVPAKRHEIMKTLAKTFPKFEFVSAGALSEEMKDWFKKFSANAPKNYKLMPNMPKKELIEILQKSRIYVHLMEGEHFGIAPIEALASGCIVLVHDSGGIKEYIPEIFRWKDYNDLKNKIYHFMKIDDKWWNSQKTCLWQKISDLKPDIFCNKVWAYLNSFEI
jgi:glycosyltransferase involved in cell wall biosynthesis